MEHLHRHDLRGTTAANFIRAGLDLSDVATTLGWKKTKVEGEIAARYVSAQEIGLATVERLLESEGNEACEPRCKPRLQ